MIFTQFIFQDAAKQRMDRNVSFPSDITRKHFRLARGRGMTLLGAQRPIRLMEATKHGESVMSVRVKQVI